MSNQNISSKLSNWIILAALTIVAFFVSCNKSDKVLQKEDDALFQSKHINIDKWRTEYIEEDSFLINGVVPSITDLSILLDNLGKPQKVINNNVGDYLIHDMFPNVKISCYVYNENIIFDVLDSLVFLRCISFSRGDKIQYKNYVFDNKMNARMIQEIFPESGKLIKGNGHGFDMISVPLSKNVISVQKVVFLLKNYKLDKILILPMAETIFM